MKTKLEGQEIIDGLTNWFADHRISQREAAPILAALCGSIVAYLANDEEHLEESIVAIAAIVRNVARKRMNPETWMN